MEKIKKMEFLPVLIAFLLLFVLPYLDSLRTSMAGYGENGNLGKNNSTKLYNYYSERTIDILHSKGISEALKYINETVRENTRYGVTHMVLHVAGHEAYHKTQDLGKAMSYLPKCAFSDECFWDYDGYQHGIFQAYFFHNRLKSNASFLVKNACAEYYNVSLLVSNNQSLRLMSTQCFHAVGHALMAYNDNDVSKSLDDCEALPESIMRDRCYYGVFMENSYLTVQNYEPDAPRQFVSINITSLCNQVKESQKLPCSYFVAWTLLLDGKDLNSSLNECFKLEDKYRVPCIYLASKHFIPNLLKDDFLKMKDSCKNMGKYEGNCLAAVAAGIRQGGAGAKRKNFNFCDTVPAIYREQCLKSS